MIFQGGKPKGGHKISKNISDQNNKKLPQAVQHLLMEIGEKTVLYHLIVMIQGKEWEAYQGLNDYGCDIVLIRKENYSKIKIEVKTRQKMYSKAKSQNTAFFNLSENEFKNCDFVVGYWFEENSFFVLPKDELKENMNKGKKGHGFRARKDKNGQLNDESKKYHNKWEYILNEVDRLTATK